MAAMCQALTSVRARIPISVVQGSSTPYAGPGNQAINASKWYTTQIIKRQMVCFGSRELEKSMMRQGNEPSFHG